MYAPNTVARPVDFTISCQIIHLTQIKTTTHPSTQTWYKNKHCPQQQQSSAYSNFTAHKIYHTAAIYIKQNAKNEKERRQSMCQYLTKMRCWSVKRRSGACYLLQVGDGADRVGDGLLRVRDDVGELLPVGHDIELQVRMRGRLLLLEMGAAVAGRGHRARGQKGWGRLSEEEAGARAV
jgi:hypothetical protein